MLQIFLPKIAELLLPCCTPGGVLFYKYLCSWWTTTVVYQLQVSWAVWQLEGSETLWKYHSLKKFKLFCEMNKLGKSHNCNASLFQALVQ